MRITNRNPQYLRRDPLRQVSRRKRPRSGAAAPTENCRRPRCSGSPRTPAAAARMAMSSKCAPVPRRPRRTAPTWQRCRCSFNSAAQSNPPALLPLPQGGSGGARPPCDRQLTRALIVPMHGRQRVRPSGASVVVAKRAPRRDRLRTPAFMRERGAECRKRIPECKAPSKRSRGTRPGRTARLWVPPEY